MKRLFFTLVMLLSIGVYSQTDSTEVVVEETKASLESTIIGYVATLQDYTIQGIEFTKEQAPLVIQEYLTFQMVYHLSIVLISLIVFILIHRFLNKIINKENDPDSALTFFSWAGKLVAFFLAIPFLQSGFIALKIIIAPKIYLIEFAASLIKSI